MDEVWIKFLVLVVLVVIYMLGIIIKDVSDARKCYSKYKKVEGVCSDIKCLVRHVKDEEGSYDIQYYSYIFNYSVDGKEYTDSREEEVTDIDCSNNSIKKDVETDIWINPDDVTDTFIPIYDDNSRRSLPAFIILLCLFAFCGLIIQFSA